MASRWKNVMFLAVAAFSAGCITLEQQTVSYQHDEARDQLRVHIVYSGIHGDGALTQRGLLKATTLTEAEKMDLLDVVQGRQVYLFDSWLPIVDLDGLCADLGEPMDPDAPEAVQRAEIALREWWSLLVQSVQVSNGPFYIDGAGRLSAVQHIAISNLRAVVKSANRAWTLRAEAWLMTAPEFETASAIREPLQITGNQLTLRFPAGDEPAGERIWLDAGLLRVSQGIATLTLGSPTTPRVTFTTPSANHYVPNAVEFVRQRFGLATDFDPGADAEAFFAAARRQ